MSATDSISAEEAQALVQWLSSSAAHSVSNVPIEVIQTHISWVFLVGDVVYKLKKRVRFQFLDFSTLAARQAACQQELLLNRRLAPDTYLDVLPISRDAAGQFYWDSSAPVDYVVHMRRLPADRMLDRLIASGAVAPADIQRLSQLLTRFYRQAAPLAVNPAEYVAHIAEHVRANGQELARSEHHLDPAQVARIQTAQQRFLAIHAETLASRARQGRVIDGHGDLRPEHICLLPIPAIFDCIEFSPELRTIDVADELSFLEMECQRLGAPEIGQTIDSDYRAESGDDASPALRAFFRIYRACVRAKVALLRATQATGPAQAEPLREALDYLDLADRQSSLVGPAPLLVVRGLMGSGKSTLARALSAALGTPHLQTDAIRQSLFGASATPASFGQGIYSPTAQQAVYRELFQQTSAALRSGTGVILDGTFLSADHRSQANALAHQHHAPFLTVVCRCPREVSLARIAKRLAAGRDPSEARPELYDLQAQQEESAPLGIVEIQVDSTQPIAAQCEIVWQALHRLTSEA
jgi:aminoglycoside phosphotransferase family enzyme/predicted kinase